VKLWRAEEKICLRNSNDTGQVVTKQKMNFFDRKLKSDPTLINFQSKNGVSIKQEKLRETKVMAKMCVLLKHLGHYW
jgi:hypothetical protein